jgi:hypothetical protein
MSNSVSAFVALAVEDEVLVAVVVAGDLNARRVQRPEAVDELQRVVAQLRAEVVAPCQQVRRDERPELVGGHLRVRGVVQERPRAVLRGAFLAAVVGRRWYTISGSWPTALDSSCTAE